MNNGVYVASKENMSTKNEKIVSSSSTITLFMCISAGRPFKILPKISSSNRYIIINVNLFLEWFGKYDVNYIHNHDVNISPLI